MTLFCMLLCFQKLEEEKGIEGHGVAEGAVVYSYYM